MVDPKSVAKVYRDQAARCRRLARQTTNQEAAKRLLELADEFEEHADRIEKEEE